MYYIMLMGDLRGTEQTAAISSPCTRADGMRLTLIELLAMGGPEDKNERRRPIPRRSHPARHANVVRSHTSNNQRSRYAGDGVQRRPLIQPPGDSTLARTSPLYIAELAHKRARARAPQLVRWLVR